MFELWLAARYTQEPLFAIRYSDDITALLGQARIIGNEPYPHEWLIIRSTDRVAIAESRP